MSDSNRGFYIVATIAGIIVLGTIGGAESRCQRQQYAYSSSAGVEPSHNEQYQFSSGRSWLPCFVERGIANPPSKNGSDKEQRDLIAQESSALWGFWIAAIALFQLIASVVGLFFIKRTLDATWKAVEDTGHATDAMREANRIASKITAAELRPYLFVERVELVDTKSYPLEPEKIVEVPEGEEAPEPPQGLFTARIEIHLRNFGKVPARKIKVYKKTYLGRMRTGRFFRYRFSVVDTWVCAPGHERRVFGGFYVQENERVEFDDGELEVFLRMRFTFEDDHGNSFQEKAAFFLSGNDLKTFYLLMDYNVAERRRRHRQYELELQEQEQEAAKKAAKTPRKRLTKKAPPKRRPRLKG